MISSATKVHMALSPILGSGLGRTSLAGKNGSLAQYGFHQVRHATLIKRPKRPYTFTQLVTLSDGSMFMHRTTSPVPVYKATKDIRNSPVWNPSSQSLANVEEDEAGKLRAFRSRFGRGWDADAPEYTKDNEATDKTADAEDANSGDFLLDLISGYGKEEAAKSPPPAKPTAPASKGKGKK